MNFLDRIPSAMRFLTAKQQRDLSPSASEAAITDIARRMGAQLPGACHA